MKISTNIVINTLLCFSCFSHEKMLLLSLASAALHGRHACVRLLSTDPGAASIALPKFLVTTVKPKSNTFM